MPGENYKGAEEQFSHKIDENSNTYSEDIIDYFHKQYKSDSTSNPIVETSATILN